MIHRETYEWTNTWWEKAENSDLPRVLLIGDSIVCGYRDFVQQNLENRVYVDRFATSKFASDPFFKKELELYLSEYKYDCIHLNHGLHGLDFSLEEYEDAYTTMLKMVMKNSANVILTLSTPITEEGKPERLSGLNNIVVERNSAVLKLAEQYGLAVDDLYTPMVGRPEYRLEDGYHYNEDGKSEQGRIVAECIAGSIAI